jgi:hypothetical protein
MYQLMLLASLFVAVLIVRLRQSSRDRRWMPDIRRVA